ncbi:minor capsid protein [Pelotomaculum propionicicum]|uniref:minor capsid protein n=1 Tax=Pelotomaculum propionicicum TaxID=258475 RepID=UPI003B9F64CF
MGEGTLNTNIFVDIQPDAPDNIPFLTVYDKGGVSPQDPPENWRELYIQGRNIDHQDGYDRIWRILNLILRPTAGFIEVGTNKYTAQLQELPSMSGRDLQNRYLFGFRVIIRSVSDISTGDEWLDTLASWTGTILTGWTVYKVWQGNNRPSVTWRLSTVQVTEKAKAVFEVRKKYTGEVLGNTTYELVFGTTKLVQELGSTIKLTLDALNKRYLTVSTPTADLREDSLTAGQVSVVLSRLTSRPSEEAPIMAGVHHKGIIIN